MILLTYEVIEEGSFDLELSDHLIKLTIHLDVSIEHLLAFSDHA